MHPRISPWLPIVACAPSAAAQDVLPKPDPPFKGKIGTTDKDSKADFPRALTAPAA